MAEQVFPSEPIATAPQPAWRTTLNTVVNFILKQREASILVIAIVLMAYFQTSNSVFLTETNIRLLSQYTAPTAMIAAGEVMLLICGEIDLSVGNAFALAPFIMYIAYQNGIPLFFGVLLGLIVCAAIGLINGLVTVFLRVPSFITTLGTLFMLNGITLVISNAFPVLPPGENTTFSMTLGQSPYSEIEWAIAIVIVMQIILYFTPWGLHTVATGGNPLGASEVGVNVNRIKIINFMACSVFGGFAGILEGFRIDTISPLAGGTDIMFAAVAGAVIGGTALNGGSGTVVGAFLGVFVISIIKDGLTLIGVSAYWFNFILGAAILIAMILNVRLQLLRKAGRE